MEKEKKVRIYKRLKNKFRLVVMNDDSFEVKFSMILSPLNVFTWGGIILILIVVIVASVIAFTPLREFIPGYADINTRRIAAYTALKTDSMAQAMKLKDQYLNNIKMIMRGESPQNPDSLGQGETTENINQIKYQVSKEDSQLRATIEKEDQYNLTFDNTASNTPDISNFHFFTPLQGLVSSEFDLKTNHFGVDIIAPKNEVIKATLDGTVIIANWTSETGHVIQIQHKNNLISVYKHNSVLLKKVGDNVKAGDGIAIIGESGELSTGPHLHFELWYNGKPINPQEFILF